MISTVDLPFQNPNCISDRPLDRSYPECTSTACFGLLTATICQQYTQGISASTLIGCRKLHLASVAALASVDSTYWGNCSSKYPCITVVLDITGFSRNAVFETPLVFRPVLELFRIVDLSLLPTAMIIANARPPLRSLP